MRENGYGKSREVVVEFDRVIDIQLIKETSNSVKGIVVR